MFIRSILKTRIKYFFRGQEKKKPEFIIDQIKKKLLLIFKEELTLFSQSGCMERIFIGTMIRVF